MVNITIQPDCGNSPKAQFIKAVNIAFARSDVAFILNSCTDHVRWEIVGDKVIEGKKDMEIALNEMKAVQAKEMTLSSIITHGHEAAAHGELVLTNGSRYRFCDMYTFNSAKGQYITSMISFVIGI